MIEMMNTTKKPKAPKLFPDELIDQLLAQIQNKDAESILGEACLWSNLNVPGREQHLRDIYSSKHSCSSDMRGTGKIYYHRTLRP